MQVHNYDRLHGLFANISALEGRADVDPQHAYGRGGIGVGSVRTIHVIQDGRKGSTDGRD